MKQTNELRKYITNTITCLLEEYIDEKVSEESKVVIMAQLEVLKEIRAICERRKKY